MNEEWRPVIGYEEYYTVSNLGRVRRSKGGVSTYAGRILRPSLNKGYPQVTLCKHGDPRSRQVHCLVAEAFLGPRPEGLTINHRDGNRGNPAVDNLEYVTQGQNNLHAYRLLGRAKVIKRGEEQTQHILTDAAVLEIRELLARPRVSLQMLADEYGFTKRKISRIVNGSDELGCSESLLTEIRARYAGRRPIHPQIAARYGVSPSTISNVTTGSHWAHVTGRTPPVDGALAVYREHYGAEEGETYEQE